MTGVTVRDGCKQAFDELKLKHTKRYIIFKIENSKEILIESEGGKEATYEDFKKAMPENEPRYAVVDVEYNTDDGRPQSKIAFILWAPDSCGVKPKMIYASSKDAIKKVLSGFAKEIQANDSSELDYEEVKKIMMK